jgi:hypothetical protein
VERGENDEPLEPSWSWCSHRRREDTRWEGGGGRALLQVSVHDAEHYKLDVAVPFATHTKSLFRAPTARSITITLRPGGGRGAFLETTYGEPHTRLPCIYPWTFVHGDWLLAGSIRLQSIRDGHRQEVTLEG